MREWSWGQDLHHSSVDRSAMQNQGVSLNYSNNLLNSRKSAAEKILLSRGKYLHSYNYYLDRLPSRGWWLRRWGNIKIILIALDLTPPSTFGNFPPPKGEAFLLSRGDLFFYFHLILQPTDGICSELIALPLIIASRAAHTSFPVTGLLLPSVDSSKRPL